jgi:hypothetical protein
MLTTPDTPIEMKVFHGGGTQVESDLQKLETPIDMKMYKGGAQETIRLSVGLVVRVVDDSLKEDIQNLKFTGDEQILFDKYLRFNHPFIKKFIVSDAVKEDFFEFWKVYVNYDGTNKYTLMTRKEGRTIQRFMEKVLDAYREYLMTTVVQFLLKQDNPEELELHLHPPPKETFHLLETVQLPVPEPELKPEPQAEPEGQENLDESNTNSEFNESNTNSEFNNSNANSEPEKPEKPEKPDLRDELREFIKETFAASDKSEKSKEYTPENKIMKVIYKLNTVITSVKDYQEKIMNAPLITSLSFKPEILPEQIIKYDFKKDPKLTEFLRKLIKVNISTFTPVHKQEFLGFFLKIISGQASKDLYIEKITAKGGKRTTRRSKLSNSLKAKHQK